MIDLLRRTAVFSAIPTRTATHPVMLLISLAAISFGVSPTWQSAGVARLPRAAVRMTEVTPDEYVNSMSQPSWDFRHGSGGKPLAANAAINGSPAMIEVAAKQSPQKTLSPSAPAPIQKVNQSHKKPGKAQPDEVAKGVVQPSWDFRHGSGGQAFAKSAAINGSPAMIEVR